MITKRRLLKEIQELKDKIDRLIKQSGCCHGWELLNYGLAKEFKSSEIYEANAICHFCGKRITGFIRSEDIRKIETESKSHQEEWLKIQEKLAENYKIWN